MALNVAVDIGGTFTDLIGYDDVTGKIYQAKSSSTPGNLVDGIMRCLEKSGLDIGQLGNFVHGSTVAINTVIEQKGARTALITTEGARDIYKIGRGNRPEAYDIFFKRPEPLVPRQLTLEVKERLLPSGEALVPFDSEQALSVAEAAARVNVDAIAVCFLHSWANPEHEALMGRILSRALPGKYITVSHEILREYGEYERISTTVLNAYIGPRVSTYVNNLEQVLNHRGFTGSLMIMQSNGGVMSPATAQKIPVAMLESGPVGGFIAASVVGKALGFNNVISLDMGGTTSKTNLVKDGEPQQAHGYYIGGYASGHPMMLPVIDTIEIGAGGGSIAWIDDVGALKVGPKSAGAEPGPICYGRGGTEPTITDANLVLGRLSPVDFLGGEMPLDVERARRGIQENICKKTALSPIEAALAITKIAVMNMSLAVRGVSVERGYDPRDFAMVAFGGAGGLHATEVARELHIPTVIVPNYPGQFSAIGMLMADVQHDYVRTYYKPLVQAHFDTIANICHELIEKGKQTLAEERVPEEAMSFQRFLDIRYSGQEFSIPVPISAGFIEQGDAGAIRKAFDDLHERRYGYHTPEQSVEIVNVRMQVTGKRGRFRFPSVHAASQGTPVTGRRMVYFESGKAPVECPIYSRVQLEPGRNITGPAVIQEYASTIVLFPGDRASVVPTGELVIVLQGGKQNG